MSTLPSPSPTRYAAELELAITTAREAAEVVRQFYESREAETYTKGDGSPVTDADLASDELIRSAITSAYPDDALLTEEGAKDEERFAHRRVWIADPLDGTAQFVAGTDRFDILLALVEDGRPVVAVSIQPPTGLLHAAVAGEGAWVSHGEGFARFALDPAPEPPRVVTSKWYRANEEKALIDRVVARTGAAEPAILEVGFQPRAFDPSERTYDAMIGLWHLPGESFANEWDLAAPDLIVHEAGGRFTDLWGREYVYNKRDTHISGGILFSASPEIHARLLEAVAPELPSAPAMDPADARL
jgi:myo-inositol-1(or 4)-monophosphatase